MKNKTKIYIVFCSFLLLTLTTVTAVEDLYNETSIGIKTPKFPIENADANIIFYIYNNGNITFNGTVIYDFSSDKMSWNENRKSVMISPNSYTVLETSITPTYPGLHWLNIKIEDDRGRRIYNTKKTFNVHSYGETSTIGAAIIALFSLILYLVFKK